MSGAFINWNATTQPGMTVEKNMDWLACIAHHSGEFEPILGGDTWRPRLGRENFCLMLGSENLARIRSIFSRLGANLRREARAGGASLEGAGLVI
jgi:hypothetical protein